MFFVYIKLKTSHLNFIKLVCYSPRFTTTAFTKPKKLWETILVLEMSERPATRLVLRVLLCEAGETVGGFGQGRLGLLGSILGKTC